MTLVVLYIHFPHNKFFLLKSMLSALSSAKYFAYNKIRTLYPLKYVIVIIQGKSNAGGVEKTLTYTNFEKYNLGQVSYVKISTNSVTRNSATYLAVSFSYFL